MKDFLMKFFDLVRRKILVQILFVMLFCIIFYSYLPTSTIAFFYSISLALKSILVMVLPLLIIGALSSSFAKIPKGGFFFAVSILIGVTLSNFINLTLAYFFGMAVVGGPETTIALSIASVSKIEPLFILPLPKLLSNGWALIIGLVVGVCCSLFSLTKLEFYANKLNFAMMFFMSKIFTRLLPIFIMGFLLKLLIEGEMAELLDKQLWASLSVILLLLGWLSVWFATAAGFKFTRLKEIFINVLPAMVTAFSTMSSAAALPLAIEAAEKNTNDKTLAHSVIPMIMNFHMLGSSMTVSVAVLIIMATFNFPLPDYSTFAVFGAFFVLNKFAGAGVPAGSIIVALPILQKTLGFSPDMLGLVLAFYIVFDPIITFANVTANSLFVIFVQKASKLIKMSYAK